ncbi:MAG: M20/M25/M40 family metallo-hydrolase [Clostridia bacterium]|nr:M20/M25/M40 family metallo-hydrolase [Clostridia bacterium]
MEVKEILERLDGARGVSGSETGAGVVFKELVGEFTDEIKEDNLGNLIAVIRCGKENAPRLMFEAHMDEIGLMVSGFTKEGSLLFVQLGGFDQKVLPGSEVTVHSEKGDFYGVIGAKPPHLTTDRSKAVAVSDMAVDVGFSEKECRERFAIGDVITINTAFTPLDGDAAAGRCFDNRAGVAAIIKAAEYMSRLRLECDVLICAAVQEEVGLRGARVICQSAKPDAAIVVDAGFGISQNSSEGFELGYGAILSVGPNLHPKLNDIIKKAAKEAKVDIEMDVEGGNTGTDAWEIQVSGEGVPTALISYATRYMHSTYEVINMRDIDEIARLLAQSALDFKGGDELCY